MHRRPRAGLLALAAAAATSLLGSGCQTRDGLTPGGSSTYVRKIDQQVGVYNDADILAYLETLKDGLAAHTRLDPNTIRVFIIDEPLPNAFAAPDGTIFISRGMLALANSEDALAAVLAHELVHISHKHHIKQARRSLISGLLALPGKAVGQVISQNLGDWVNAPIESIGDLYLAGYSRSQEEEADMEGIALMQKAGYDPAAMGRILRQMDETLTLIHGGLPPSSFFDSHPSMPNRIDNILAHAETLAAEDGADAKPPAAIPRPAFLERLNGLAFGVNPSHGLFRESTFLHPDHNLVMEFPEGWTTINTPLASGAMSQQNQGAVYLGSAGYGSDPMPYGERIRRVFYEEFRIEPFREGSLDLNGNDAYLLAYRDHTAEEPTHIFFLWVAQDGRIFQGVGVADLPRSPTVERALMSLRPMTEAERNSITVLRIRLARAEPNETLPELSRRTGNRWTDAVTAIANEIPENIRFAGGEWLKVVQEEPYWAEEDLDPSAFSGREILLKP